MKPHRLSVLALALFSALGCNREGKNDGGAVSESVAKAATVSTAARHGTIDDLDQLQGEWRIELLVWDGVSNAQAGGVVYKFEANKFIAVEANGARHVETIKLMPSQGQKAIDCWDESGRHVPGIYALKGDKLTWCVAGGGNKKRPTSFSSHPGSKQSLMVFRRK